MCFMQHASIGRFFALILEAHGLSQRTRQHLVDAALTHEERMALRVQHVIAVRVVHLGLCRLLFNVLHAEKRSNRCKALGATRCVLI